MNSKGKGKDDLSKGTTWSEDAHRVKTTQWLPPHHAEMNVIYPRLHKWEWEAFRITESQMGVLDEMRAMRQTEERKIDAINQNTETLTEIMSAIERIALAQEGLFEVSLAKKIKKPRPPVKANKILDKIQEQGEDGLTDDEGKVIFGDKFNYRQLRCYLVRQNKIVASQHQREARSGQRVQVWVATEYADFYEGDAH